MEESERGQAVKIKKNTIKPHSRGWFARVRSKLPRRNTGGSGSGRRAALTEQQQGLQTASELTSEVRVDLTEDGDSVNLDSLKKHLKEIFPHLSSLL